jgi:hypothetical protein
MTRTKLARTVAKSATGSTTAPSSATSLQTLSVEFVVTLGTWRETAQTDSEVQTGAMDLLLLEGLADLPAVLRLAVLALAMQSTENMR